MNNRGNSAFSKHFQIYSARRMCINKQCQAASTIGNCTHSSFHDILLFDDKYWDVYIMRMRNAPLRIGT